MTLREENEMTAVEERTDQGVAGNARLTGVVGALLLVALAIEGITVPSVRGMLTLHVFIGIFVIPVVCLKLASTGYRFFHYYRGTAAYRHKGPPHPILRVTAPLLVVTTLTLLGTGVVMLAVGPQHSDSWRTLHQASFIGWFALMTIHVLGHAYETWKLATDELRAAARVRRRKTRVSLVACSLVVGLIFGVASLSWTSAWKNRPRHKRQNSIAVLVSPKG
jgi:hypothetical protein